jgi:hypothetical protein
MEMFDDEFLKKLAPILEKNPIVETAKASDVLNSATEQEEFYNRACIAYHPLHDEKDFEDKLVSHLGKGKAAVGAIVAPYGYGKTSFLAYLWRYLELRDFIVVPPFCFSSFQDIVHAVYGWVKHKLQNRMPHQTQGISDAYKHTVAVSVEEQARLLSEQDGRDDGQHLHTLRQLVKAGKWEPEINALEVVRFLEVCTQAAGEAGFEGIIVLADEMQQFISQASSEFRERLGQLFNLVTHVETRTFPVCFLMGMLSASEAAIQSIRGDLLDRLKQDNLYVDLQRLYDESTPGKVWHGMLNNIGASKYGNMVADECALRACGQIAFDPELGNGPRTMVRVFQQAIRKYDATKQPYTPINLIDDYLNNEIQYDGAQAKLRNAVSRALETDFVRNSESNTKAIKLMGAFPKGLSEKIQRDYEVSDAVRGLSQRVHGTLIEWAIEGFTLRELRRGVQQGTLDRIISTFWRDYTEDEERLKEAQSAFNRHILPKLFEIRRGNTLDKWSSYELKRIPMEAVTYKTETSGSFNPKYPERTLTLYTTANVPESPVTGDRTQFMFGFELVLDRSKDPFDPGNLRIEDYSNVIFSLHMLRRVSSGELPTSLVKLQDFMQPKDVNPLLMLSLANWVEEWDDRFPEQRIPEQDRPEIFQHMLPLMIDYSIRTLFSEDLSRTSGYNYRNVGTQLVGEILDALCEHRWPDYCTMYVGINHQDLLRRYQNVLESEDLSLKQKRGSTTIKIEKEALCDLLGWQSIATLENRLRGEYGRLSLVNVHDWSGNQAELTLSQHPLEQMVMKKLYESTETRIFNGDEVQVIDGRDALDDAIKHGYSEEEFAWAIQLLGARRLAASDPEEGLLVLAKGGLSVEQVRDNFAEQEEKCLILSGLAMSKEDREKAVDVARSFEAIKATLYQPEVEDNEEELNEISFIISRRFPEQLMTFQTQIMASLTNAIGKIIGEAEQKQIEYDRLLRNLREQKVTGRLPFADFLENVRVEIQGKISSHLELCRDIEQKARKLIPIDQETSTERLEKTKLEADKLGKQLDETTKRSEELKGQFNDHEEWRSLLTMGSELYTSVREYRMNDLADRLSQVSERIRRAFAEDIWKALSNHKGWQADFDDIQTQQKSRVEQGEEEFSKLKEHYHRMMREAGIHDYRCISEFHFNNPERSRRNLINEVLEKMRTLVESASSNIGSLNDTIVRAQHLQEKGTDEESALESIVLESEEVKQEFNKLRDALTMEMIADVKILGDFISKLNNATRQVAILENRLFKSVLVRKLAEGDEVSVLDQLTREPQELARIAVPLITQHRMNTQRLFDILEKLYSKNLIKIEISQLD